MCFAMRRGRMGDHRMSVDGTELGHERSPTAGCVSGGSRVAFASLLSQRAHKAIALCKNFSMFY